MDIMSQENKSELPSELEVLKGRADDIGLEYHPSIGVDKLRVKVDAALKPKATSSQVKAINKMEARQEFVKVAKKLKRVRIVNMNPNKRESKGEYITVANKMVGTIKRFVPFDVDWHIENFIYEVLHSRKFRITREIPDGKGGKTTKNSFIPEFNIEVLGDLTKKELEELAADQAKRGAIDSE
jgi:hypothetical protein